MGRTIAAVVVGYLVMFVIVFVTFSIAFGAMGVDKAFRPGTYEVSGTWLITSTLLAIAAAMVGGVVCAVIARSSAGPKALAALVFVLGLAMAVPTLSPPKSPTERTANVGPMEAMQTARTPAWVAFLNPFIGAAGVLVGARQAGKAKGGSRPE